MRDHLRRSLLVIALAVLGIGVSVAIDRIHDRLALDHSYTSFCNVNSSVNCDVVLGSRYALLFGVPVSRWAILFYAASIALAGAVMRTSSATARTALSNLLVVQQIWGVLFSAYLAYIAVAVLQTVCLMCGALYLIGIGLFVAAWWLRSGVRVVGRRQRQNTARVDRLVLLGAAVAIALLVVIGGWEALGGSYQRASNAADIARLRPEFYQWFLKQPVLTLPADGANSFGDTQARVTVVEFSDFECAHCLKFHEAVERVMRGSGDDVRVVFRHFPLDASCNPKVPSRVHQQACLAADAAECAAEQGKFWEYHNVLFDNQQELGREFLIAYAERLGLDGQRFATCLGSNETRARVERDARLGAELGIDSTPTVFINGRMIKGALDPDQLADALVLARDPTLR